MESEVIRLSLAVARKVIHAEVLQNSDVIVQNLKHVLKMVTEKDTILVRPASQGCGAGKSQTGGFGGHYARYQKPHVSSGRIDAEGRRHC